MPWCDGCDRFMNPNTLRADGTCPSCMRQVADPSANPAPPVVRTVSAGEVSTSAVDTPKAPWHFKLLVVATVIYLAWRLVEFFTLLV